MNYQISHHAEARMQQRGIKRSRLDIILDYADLCKPVGKRLQANRLSNRAVEEAIADGLNVQEIMRVLRMVVVSADNGDIVTCAVLHGQKAKNYTRRDRAKFWRR